MVAARAFHQYNPDRVNVAWQSLDLGAEAGLISIEVSKPNRRWRMEKQGTLGTRVKNDDRQGIVRLTYPQGSPINEKLQALADADDLAEAIVGPLTIEDKNGGTKIVANFAFIEDDPDAALGRDHGTTVWVFLSPHVDYFRKGSAVVG